MTKRVIALFLVCILAIPILLVPVAATSTTVTVDSSQWDFIKSIQSTLYSLTYDYVKLINSGVSGIYGLVTNIWQNLPGYFDDITDALDSLDTNVSSYTTKLWDKLVDIKYDTNDIINLLKINISDLLTSIDNTCGYIYETLVNNFLEIFQNIEIKIDSLISGGDQKADSEDFKTDVDNANDELDEAGKVIDSATLPTIEDDFDADISDNIESGARYFSLLKRFFSRSGIPGTVLLMSFTLSTVSYVFFGKRG